MSGLLLLPYVGEYPEEVAAALAEAGTYEWALLATQLGPGPQAYADELNRVWTLCGMANVGLMVVEHDMGFINTISDIVTVLCDGSVLAQGSLAQVQGDERVIEVYLGR